MHEWTETERLQTLANMLHRCAERLPKTTPFDRVRQDVLTAYHVCRESADFLNANLRAIERALGMQPAEERNDR